MTPGLEGAAYLNGYRIRLLFDDGRTGVLDMKDELWGEVFEPLRDLELFRAFRVDRNLSTIVWPTGADLAPEYLYEQALKNPTGGADPGDERAPAEQAPELVDDTSLAAATGGCTSSPGAPVSGRRSGGRDAQRGHGRGAAASEDER